MLMSNSRTTFAFVSTPHCGSNIVVLSLGGLCTRPPAWQTAGVIALWKNHTIKTRRG